jgi:hypothetical protein
LAFLLSVQPPVLALALTLSLSWRPSSASSQPLPLLDELIESIIALARLALVLIVVAVDFIACRWSGLFFPRFLPNRGPESTFIGGFLSTDWLKHLLDLDALEVWEDLEDEDHVHREQLPENVIRKEEDRPRPRLLS